MVTTISSTEDFNASESKHYNCDECKLTRSIYQCPGCNIRTCSLKCCRGHKERTGCSGKRSRGDFLSMNRMTDSTMRSDYFFLEEVLNQIPRSQKRARVQESTANHMSKKTRRLMQQVERRGTTLKVMPAMMERRKSNNSWYCGPRDIVTWKVEVLIFPDESMVSFQLSENEENIMEHVSDHCRKAKIILSGTHCLFLKRIPCSAKNPRYLAIDSTDTLKLKLKGMEVIEYPTIYCVPEEEAHNFSTGSDKIAEVLENTNGPTIDNAPVCE